jgi:hypothetical protein
MTLSASFRILIFSLLLCPSVSKAQGFLTYIQEMSFLKLMLNCPRDKTLPATKSFGSLYICTLGNERTIKLYVSEEPDTGEVLNIGLLWNDFKINTGSGRHSDVKEAEKVLAFLLDMYVPTKRKEIEEAFWLSLNKDFSSSEFSIYLTYKEGLQKDERLLVIEEK